MLSVDSTIVNLVIGSGPTGYATVLSLLDQGKKVFLIDPALPLFPSSSDSFQVTAQKGLFGSTEMYRVSWLSRLKGATRGIPYSEARGGLSTTWGAGLQVYPDKHFENWPCKGRGMQNSYQRILSQLDHVYIEDSLSSRFPWPTGARTLAPSESRLGKFGCLTAERLFTLKKILIGQARLAISQIGDRKCQLCSGCLEGCPYDSIFNSGNELLRIAESNNQLQILSGFISEIVVPTSTNERFQIKIENTADKISILTSENLYLALGAIGTPALLFRSGIVTSKISIRDSQVFYAAFFSFKRMDDAAGTSLAKLFIVNKKPEYDEFHLSLYSPNFEISKRIEQKIYEMCKVKIRIPKLIANRIVAGIGFIDPEDSGKILMEMQDKEIILRKSINPETKKKIQGIVGMLTKELRKIGLFKIPFSTQIPDVATGFHSGGGLVELMKSDQNGFDEFGRLRRNGKLMVTDASTMPFNIAGPHTLTAMAHAYRNAQIN